MKRGTLCAGRFEQGNATYWEVRRATCNAGHRTWLVYRTSVAVTLIGEYRTPEDAYAVFFKHVPWGSDLESWLGG